MRRRRRQELQNIKSLGDFNELSISGHVEQRPVLLADDDHEHVCEFVLTHTTTSWPTRWERQRYNVQAYGQLAKHYATHWQPDQAIVIDGRLEHRVSETLAGLLPSVVIVAHCIDPTLGPHPHTSQHQHADA